MKLFNSSLSVIVTFCILSSFLSIFATDEEAAQASRAIEALALHQQEREVADTPVFSQLSYQISAADNEYKDGDEERSQASNAVIRARELPISTPVLDIVFSFFDHATGYAAHFVCHSWNQALDERFLEHMLRAGLFRTFNGSHSFDSLVELAERTCSNPDRLLLQLTAFEQTLGAFPVGKPTLEAVTTMGPVFFVKGWISCLLGYFGDCPASESYNVFVRQCQAVAKECHNTITHDSLSLPFLGQAVTFIRGARHDKICESFLGWLHSHKEHELIPHVVEALFASGYYNRHSGQFNLLFDALEGSHYPPDTSSRIIDMLVLLS